MLSSGILKIARRFSAQGIAAMIHGDDLRSDDYCTAREELSPRRTP
jgi:hypothetical protein